MRFIFLYILQKKLSHNRISKSCYIKHFKFYLMAQQLVLHTQSTELNLRYYNIPASASDIQHFQFFRTAYYCFPGSITARAGTDGEIILLLVLNNSVTSPGLTYNSNTPHSLGYSSGDGPDFPGNLFTGPSHWLHSIGIHQTYGRGLGL